MILWPDFQKAKSYIVQTWLVQTLSKVHVNSHTHIKTWLANLRTVSENKGQNVIIQQQCTIIIKITVYYTTISIQTLKTKVYIYFTCTQS